MSKLGSLSDIEGAGHPGILKGAKKAVKSGAKRIKKDVHKFADDNKPYEGAGTKKGQPSKTRPGKIAFRTHKGDKMYNRGGRRQKRAEGAHHDSEPFMEGSGVPPPPSRMPSVGAEAALGLGQRSGVEGSGLTLSGGRTVAGPHPHHFRHHNLGLRRESDMDIHGGKIHIGHSFHHLTHRTASAARSLGHDIKRIASHPGRAAQDVGHVATTGIGRQVTSNLVGTAAGAALGTAGFVVGGPAGAAVGATVGKTAGSALTNKYMPKVKGRGSSCGCVEGGGSSSRSQRSKGPSTNEQLANEAGQRLAAAGLDITTAAGVQAFANYLGFGGPEYRDLRRYMLEPMTRYAVKIITGYGVTEEEDEIEEGDIEGDGLGKKIRRVAKKAKKKAIEFHEDHTVSGQVLKKGKQLAGKGGARSGRFQKGSPEAKEWAKKMREARERKKSS